ncbi:MULTISPECIES: hypothetical protein [unclassified Polaribacter]|uniref:hypothetical protein n=1 Tax=unclassified Polaribacter TaxID=196858 RepID=UPI00140B2EE1|nr:MULTISPECIES: hypothetical protein [unclassified Polaribacter]
MKKFLNSNLFLIALIIIIICYIISFISTDVVLSDEVYNKYLNEKFETKYNDFKDLDLDLSDFEDELQEFEQNAAETNTYGWDYLYIDLIAILVPMLIVVFGFSGTFLILLLFHKRLHIIKFSHLLKASFLSYVLFYFTEIISAIYFLIFNNSYQLNDIQSFSSKFTFSTFFVKEETSTWLWKIVSQTDFVFFLFPLFVVLLIKVFYANFKLSLLLRYSYISYLIVFVFYNTVFWYLFDLF